jgi:hypothetical protein
LTPPEKKIFIELVANNKPEHFRPSDMPLLCAYVHACAAEATLARLIAKDDKALLRWEKTCRVIQGLSMRLRLSPQSRTPTHTAPRPSSNGGQHTPANYYERMRLENGDGDEAQ